MNENTRHPDGNFYGRRVGRPINQSRKAALSSILPQCVIQTGDVQGDETLDPCALFPKRYDEHWLEIGFGTGEHLLPLLARHAERAYIGVEPYINGMSAFCKSIVETHKEPPPNLRLWMDDAVILAQSFAPSSLDGIYILNPDPWHKLRHHKRRIVRPETLDIYARILKPGGQLIMSTDVPYLADWMILHTFNHPDFEWAAKRAKDWRVPPKDWVHTAYETKRAKGAGTMVYLFFTRK